MTRLEVRVIAKIAAYTLLPNLTDKPGQIFSNRGATGSVTFTLAPPSAKLLGHWYEFWVQADQSLIVAGAASGDLCAPGNAAADNVGFQTAGQKVGGKIMVGCDGTSWCCFGLRANGGFCVNGVELSAVASQGVTAGTVTAGKVDISDANKDLGSFRNLRTVRLLHAEGAPTSVSTVGNVVYTAAQLVGGIIVRDTNGGSRTDTTDTAAAIVAAIPGAAVGDIFDCLIVNGADAAEVITLAGGAGVTFDANQVTTSRSIQQNASKLIRIRLTNVTPAAEAAVIYA